VDATVTLALGLDKPKGWWPAVFYSQCRVRTTPFGQSTAGTFHTNNFCLTFHSILEHFTLFCCWIINIVDLITATIAGNHKVTTNFHALDSSNSRFLYSENRWFRFKLRKAKAARNRVLTVALNGKKKELRKAGKI